jgi:hypothetical protein
MRNDAESRDLLLQDAPTDMFMVARERALATFNGNAHSQVASELEGRVRRLRAPLDPLCYGLPASADLRISDTSIDALQPVAVRPEMQAEHSSVGELQLPQSLPSAARDGRNALGEPPFDETHKTIVSDRQGDSENQHPREDTYQDKRTNTIWPLALLIVAILLGAWLFFDRGVDGTDTFCTSSLLIVSPPRSPNVSL